MLAEERMIVREGARYWRLFLVSGIIQAVASRAVNPYWWVGLIVGILLVLLAFWVSGSDRVYALAQRTYLILFWVGFFAIFRGISQILLAFTVRHAGEEVAAR